MTKAIVVKKEAISKDARPVEYVNAIGSYVKALKELKKRIVSASDARDEIYRIGKKHGIENTRIREDIHMALVDSGIVGERRFRQLLDKHPELKHAEFANKPKKAAALPPTEEEKAETREIKSEIKKQLINRHASEDLITDQELAIINYELGFAANQTATNQQETLAFDHVLQKHTDRLNPKLQEEIHQEYIRQMEVREERELDKRELDELIDLQTIISGLEQENEELKKQLNRYKASHKKPPKCKQCDKIMRLHVQYYCENCNEYIDVDNCD